MPRFSHLGLVAVGLVALGCGGSNSLATMEIRGINLVRGASSTVSIVEDTGSLGTLTENTASGYQSATTFPQSVSAYDTTTQTSIGVTTLTPGSGAFYSVIAYGVEGASPAAGISIVTDIPPTLSKTAANIRFGNYSGASNKSVDVYITAPGAKLTNVTPSFTAVPYGTILTYSQLAGGTYEFRVFATGTTTNPIVDDADVVVANDADYTIVTSDNSSGQSILLSITDVY